MLYGDENYRIARNSLCDESISCFKTDNMIVRLIRPEIHGCVDILLALKRELLCLIHYKKAIGQRRREANVVRPRS